MTRSRGRRAQERDLLYIMYTSGTTGRAKGVMHANRTALWNSRRVDEILGLTHDDVAYSMFPLFHVTARSAVVTATMWAGGRVHLADGFSATRFWDEVKQAKATWFGYMGIVIHLLHAQPPRADDADNNVRIAFGAAAPAGDHGRLRRALRAAARRGLRRHRARPGERAQVSHTRASRERWGCPAGT